MTSFVISDTHFGHAATVERFRRPDGSMLRPFASVEEMDEEMVKRWNSVVRPSDKVYHLGDVVINKKFLPVLDRLNGSKRLIMGNHDIFGHDLYLKYFKQVVGYRVFVDDFIFSHIPLHPDSVGERFVTNVHGHLHDKRVILNDDVDPRYFSACVEHHDYTPVSFDDLKKMIKNQQEATGYTPASNGWGNGSGPG